jgi:hypothetical protein
MTAVETKASRRFMLSAATVGKGVAHAKIKLAAVVATVSSPIQRIRWHQGRGAVKICTSASSGPSWASIAVEGPLAESDVCVAPSYVVDGSEERVRPAVLPGPLVDHPAGGVETVLLA